jgi:hypothetical protein
MYINQMIPDMMTSTVIAEALKARTRKRETVLSLLSMAEARKIPNAIANVIPIR